MITLIIVIVVAYFIIKWLNKVPAKMAESKRKDKELFNQACKAFKPKKKGL